MKKCFKCSIEKELSEFYKHNQMADGHLNKCKECSKADTKKNYKQNIQYYREYERSRATLPHRVEARGRYANTEAGKEAGNAAKSRWARRNPVKRFASAMVGNAVRSGKILKPDACEDCKGTPVRLHGHHDDYAKPLDVRWLCPACHNKWHKENGPGLNSC